MEVCMPEEAVSVADDPLCPADSEAAENVLSLLSVLDFCLTSAAYSLAVTFIKYFPHKNAIRECGRKSQARLKDLFKMKDSIWDDLKATLRQHPPKGYIEQLISSEAKMENVLIREAVLETPGDKTSAKLPSADIVTPDALKNALQTARSLLQGPAGDTDFVEFLEHYVCDALDAQSVLSSMIQCGFGQIMPELALESACQHAMKWSNYAQMHQQLMGAIGDLMKKVESLTPAPHPVMNPGHFAALSGNYTVLARELHSIADMVARQGLVVPVSPGEDLLRNQRPQLAPFTSEAAAAGTSNAQEAAGTAVPASRMAMGRGNASTCNGGKKLLRADENKPPSRNAQSVEPRKMKGRAVSNYETFRFRKLKAAAM
ncbi:hypothetical protein COCOBI_11-0110 [Coccomyxa sp. Obi]|nr:hypothetical protein COCOBI_11-0110 [Coccomyxa sp. Obi]